MARKPAFDEGEADRRLEADSTDVVALIAKGDHRVALGNRRNALAFYQAALNAAGQGADGHASDLQHAQDMLVQIQQGMPQHLVDSLSAAGHTPQQWHPRFRQSLAIMLGQSQRAGVTERYPQMPTAYFYPGLPHVEFVDPHQFWWRDQIEAATDTIRAEAAQLPGEAGLGAYVRSTQERPQGDVHGMLENDSWSTFDLTVRGEADAERVARYPETYRTISNAAPLCDIAGRAPSVMFSRLAAGSKIPPHTGMINTRLICHLPLIVPGEGALRVGTQTKVWVEGQVIVFDDTVEHEAWNNADADRLVLIFDIWRPELADIERAQVRALFDAVDSY